ncbi:MAG: pirin family protein [Gammaproteobacteria bacterium]|nr:pirin family protein [Gammaproteobacteria bacterium]
MTTERRIAGIYRGAPIHWVGDGFRVSNYFPSGNDFGSRASPFILMDYAPPYRYPPTDNHQRGVGPHPHRGFETVTLAFEGAVAHHDSSGNEGVIGPGDVQWMTAASGVLHKEYHEREFARRGGNFHMMQLWVNLPAAHKMDHPRYQALTAAQMGRVELPDNSGHVRVIAGEYSGVKGPAVTVTPLGLFDIRLSAGGSIPLSFPAHENTLALVMRGAIEVQGRTANGLDLVLFENAGEAITLRASQDAQVLLLNGEPIHEPVVHYGPFVMNTQAEIRQAMIDFNAGKFGVLTD